MLEGNFFPLFDLQTVNNDQNGSKNYFKTQSSHQQPPIPNRGSEVDNRFFFFFTLQAPHRFRQASFNCTQGIKGG